MHLCFIMPIYNDFYLVCFIDDTGDNVQQEFHLHPSDHGHDRITPVPGHATTQHFQRARLHHGLLHHIQAISRGAQTHLGNHTRNQSIYYNNNNNIYHSFQIFSLLLFFFTFKNFLKNIY